MFYFRYVDDTILCIKEDELDIVLKKFNSYDRHLQFTHELQNNNMIPFLDVALSIDKNSIITNWYQKPTNSNRVLNFNSNHTIQLKRNIIYNLVDRALLLSHEKFHTENLFIVKKILGENSWRKKWRNPKKRGIYEHKRTPSDKLLPIPTDINNFCHSFNFEKVKILDREQNSFKRLISESLFININNNNINKQEDFNVIRKQYYKLNRYLNNGASQDV